MIQPDLDNPRLRHSQVTPDGMKPAYQAFSMEAVVIQLHPDGLAALTPPDQQLNFLVLCNQQRCLCSFWRVVFHRSGPVQDALILTSGWSALLGPTA